MEALQEKKIRQIEKTIGKDTFVFILDHKLTDKPYLLIKRLSKRARFGEVVISNYTYQTTERRDAVISEFVSRKEKQEEERQKNPKKRELSSAALAAKAIREELKQAFPNIKFSVTSDTFSMGNSVNIDYCDGVKTSAVEAITDKYQYGNFNGMEDIYELTNRREDISQAKYVMVQRKCSNETRRKIWSKLCKQRKELEGNELTDPRLCYAYGHHGETLISQEFHENDY